MSRKPLSNAGIPRIMVLPLVFVLTLTAGAASAVAITRGPYLQNLTTNTMVIVWKTDVASDSRVDFGLSTPYSAFANDAALVTQHAVTLTGLAQGAVYHYQVTSGGTALTGDLLFRSGKGVGYDSFLFVAMGDHRSDPAAHLSVAQRVQAIDPEIVLDVGDLTNDGTNASLWDTEFFTPEKDVMSRACLFPAIGNHEGNAANYLSYFYLPTANSGTERYYSFDYANAHFVAVDNYSSYAAGSAQYNWLAADLAANQSKAWTFVFMHAPPYSSGQHGSDLAVRAALCPLFEAYGVDMVFTGHDHHYERAYVNGIYYVVTGGGGAPLRPVGSNSWTQFSASEFECCRINVTGKSLSMQVLRPNGTVLDSLSFGTSGFYNPVFFLE
jgi:hypothetical protein